MPVRVTVPTILQSYTGGHRHVEVEGSTVRAVIENLAGRYPGLGERLLHDDGSLHRFVNIYVGDQDARFLEGLDTPVPDGAEVTILPAVSGG